MTHIINFAFALQIKKTIIIIALSQFTKKKMILMLVTTYNQAKELNQLNTLNQDLSIQDESLMGQTLKRHSNFWTLSPT